MVFILTMMLCSLCYVFVMFCKWLVAPAEVRPLLHLNVYDIGDTDTEVSLEEDEPAFGQCP